MDKKELFNEFLQRVRPCASITDDMLDEILHLRQQLATKSAEAGMFEVMFCSANDDISNLEQQLAAVEKERNAFQDQCIRMKHERVLEKEQLAAALAACDVKNVALQEVAGLISESSGVYGLHLNGDSSPWEEVEVGGRFERLTTLPEALAIQPDASALRQHDEALIEKCAKTAHEHWIRETDVPPASAIRELKGKL